MALYAREVSPPDPDPESFLYRYEMWEKLHQAIENDEVDAVVVAFPEVLGDNYTELVLNLSRIARSGKLLAVTGHSPFLKQVGEVE